MELGLVRKVDIDAEMQQSYLDYAMSVIVSRALPDARDGLKPVQRRILYAMYDMGVRADSTYKKSARIVGEVLGKYHPHGDSAVYEAMARMAQDFSLRYPLVDGQGNFGSVDGDPPAAMRYTEARLSGAAMDILLQLDKDTVNYSANFDDTLTEPDVLPAAIPNLLVNGATGIAVGMATNIPPHNLGEVVDALIYMINHWEKQDDITVDDLMHFIHGPDFPTGGLILQDPQGDGLKSAYGTGRGRVIVQARAHLEEMGRNRSRIIVTELPYMTNKSSLIERIAELAREGHMDGLSDLRDESDRQGMRIVIELKGTADPEKILRDLYHRTPMQSTFGIMLLALVDGEPRLLSLKQALRVYVEHRLVVIKRRSEHDLAKARARAHILEGLRVALQHLDEIINLIRNSADVEQARKRLMSRYRLSELQANAILEMPLRRLAALERKKIETEYKELMELIKALEGLLLSPKRMRQVVSEELLAVRKAYADRRRTQIVRIKEGETIHTMLTTTDVVPAQTVWVGVSQDGRICRTHGEALPDLMEREAPRWLIPASTHDTLYLAATNGRTAAVAVHALPESDRVSAGAVFHRISPLTEADNFATLFVLPQRAEGLNGDSFLLTVTRDGMVKKTALGELPGPSSQPFTLARVNEGDALSWAMVTGGQDEILIITRQGMGIRFSESEVRPMGLVAAGVGGVKLGKDDRVVGAVRVNPAGEVFLLASDGKAKRVNLKEFPVQSRYGQGVIAWKVFRGISLIACTSQPADQDALVHFQVGEPIPIQYKDAPLVTRASQGRPVVEVEMGDAIVDVTPAEPMSSAASPGSDGMGSSKKKPRASRARAAVEKAPNGKARGAGKASAKTAPSGKSAGKSTPAAKKAAAAAVKAPPAAKKPARTKTEPAQKKTTRAVETAAVQLSLLDPVKPAPKAKGAAGSTPQAESQAASRAAGKGKGSASAPASKTPAARKPAVGKAAPAVPAAKKPAGKNPAPKKPAPAVPAPKKPKK